MTEPLNLRIKDVILGESKLHVYQSKGGEGLVVLFSFSLAGALQQPNLLEELLQQNGQSAALLIHEIRQRFVWKTAV